MDDGFSRIEAKSILSKLGKPDPWFGISYNMNLYRGCGHGCIYCDTRSACYGIGDISRIAVKENALGLLRRELKSKRRKGTVGTGSMNDPYMPLEKRLGLIRGALEIISGGKYPVHIITKGTLVVRDADVLQDISRTYAAVSFTITTADDELSRKLEPGAPATSERFAAIRELAAKGIYTGVTMMPMLPFINDTPENVSEIVRRARDAGASYVIPMFGVTLREGSREYYYEALDRFFPGVKEKYTERFGDAYVCDSPARRELMNTFRRVSGEVGMKGEMDFYAPPPDPQGTLF